MPTSSSSRMSGRSQTGGGISQTPLVEWNGTQGPWGATKSNNGGVELLAPYVENSGSLSTEGVGSTPTAMSGTSAALKRRESTSSVGKTAFERAEVGPHVSDKRRAANALASLRNMEEMYAQTVQQKNEHIASLQQELDLFMSTAKMDKDSELFRLQEELCNAISSKEAANNKITSLEAEKKLLRAAADSERRKYQVELDKRDERIDHLERKLKEKDRKIAAANKAASKEVESSGNAREEEMKKLQEQLTQRNTEISKLKLQLHDKSQKLKDLKDVEAEKEMFKAKTAEKEEKVHQLAVSLRENEKKLKEVESEISSALNDGARARAVSFPDKEGVPVSHLPVPRPSAGNIQTDHNSRSKAKAFSTPKRSISSKRESNVTPPSRTPKTPARTPGSVRKQASVAVKDLKKISIGLGSLALLNLGLTSLEGLGEHEDIVDLYMQNNNLQSFRHMGVQPNMKELNVENNNIKSFEGFEIQPRLEKLFMKNNPICDQPQFRVMALMAAGPSLRKINDEVVSSFERQRASQYGATVAADIRRGLLLGQKCKLEGDRFVLVEDVGSADGSEDGITNVQ